ncbi:hypothetical protein GCM10019016_121120 [Streptomyces prasinosporus]|uniref:Uncharacterized protein n=1 Tax=Streptomyces prasinosporus TaxID=68256 RepID=A0ABP6UDH8_9ACTN
MPERGHRHDPLPDARKVQVRQGEVAEVVGAEPHLGSVRGPGERPQGEVGVVGRQIDGGREGVGERP